MSRINCWEYMKCGREEGGEEVEELGVCPAASLSAADGFLEGRNAGRGCAYVAGTFCGGKPQGTFAEKRETCYSCEFYRLLKVDHGIEMSALHFFRYVRKKKITAHPQMTSDLPAGKGGSIRVIAVSEGCLPTGLERPGSSPRSPS